MPTGLLVGLVTVDVVQRVDRAPGPDEKVRATRADVAAGGPATGAAVTFARLGGDALLLTTVGTGPLASLVHEDLRRHHVRVHDAAPASGGPSVSAVTVVRSTGQRSVVSRNAEDATVVPPSDLAALVERARVVLLDGHHPLLALATARAAHDRGVPVVLDAGSWKPVLEDLLRLTRMAVCSADFRTPDGRPGGKDLLDAGPSFLAVTGGPRPVRWWTGGQHGTVPVPSTVARDTLGAGDVLHGALARGVADGLNEVAALHRAVAVASLRVAHVGPRSWLTDPGLDRIARGSGP